VAKLAAGVAAPASAEGAPAGSAPAGSTAPAAAGFAADGLAPDAAAPPPAPPGDDDGVAAAVDIPEAAAIAIEGSVAPCKPNVCIPCCPSPHHT
jgi:hypothetical protein